MCAATRGLAISVVAVLACAAANGVRADESADYAPELSATDPIRVTRVDVPNVAASILPDGRADLTVVSVERWASRGRAGIGIGVGSIALVDRTLTAAPGSQDTNAVTRATGSLLMLGLRYRATDQSSLYARAINVRGLSAGADERVVGKVGIEFKAAQSQWGVDYGGLGLRLAGDARVTLKLRRGGLGLFMRRSF